jgi:hypothetical protein
MKNLKLGLLISVVIFGSNAQAAVPACVQTYASLTADSCAAITDSNLNYICIIRARAEEYALRGWYSDAISKAEAAHLGDSSNTDTIQQLLCYQQSIANALNADTLASAQTTFPELELETVGDQANSETYFSNAVTSTQQYVNFAVSFIPQIQSSTWSIRENNGQLALGSVAYSQLQNFAQFLNFEINDLNSTTNVANDSNLNVNCNLYYPLQVAISSQSVYPLISSVVSVPACYEEAFRAMVIQVFTVNGQASTSPVIPNSVPPLVDSSFVVIPSIGPGNQIGLSGSTPIYDNFSLDYPNVVMAKEVSDQKMINAVVDSIYNAQVAANQTAMSQDSLNQIVSTVSQFLTVAGATDSTKTAFYQGIVSYSITFQDQIHLQIGAQFAELLTPPTAMVTR